MQSSRGTAGPIGMPPRGERSPLPQNHARASDASHRPPATNKGKVIPPRTKAGGQSTPIVLPDKIHATCSSTDPTSRCRPRGRLSVDEYYAKKLVEEGREF